MNKQSKIYVAGHRGMVGSAIVRCLKKYGYNNIIKRTSNKLDLTLQAEVERFFEDQKPDYVFMAAARVGGILANNTYRAEFIYTNLQIQNNIIHSSWKHGVRKLLFFSSSCVYPRLCTQPMKEDYLLSGKLETTNEPYAVAKLAGMTMCQAYNDQYGTLFFSVIPTNLYGINDNYDPEQSHMVAALISKIHNAKVNNSPHVTLWGTGTPRRELMYVDDVADAAVFLIPHYSDSKPINIGIGKDYTISEIAQIVKIAIGYNGKILFDTSKPDGTPQKLLNVDKLSLMGWNASISLEDGIHRTYKSYLQRFK